MKRFQLILLSVFSIFTAQAQLSQLDLSTSNQQAFDLYFNGQLLASEVAQVSLTEIPPGNHQLQIVQSFQNTWSNGFGNQTAQTLFNGTLNISSNTLIEAVIHENQFIIQNQTALIPLAPSNVYYGNSHPGHNGNHFGNSNNGQGNVYGQNPNYIPGMNTHWNVPAPQQPVYNFAPQAMHPFVFQQLLATINNQWFSSGQMSVFNQALATNFFTSQQVRELVQQFTFSSDQLKVAKKAYTKTVDPQNYFVVNDALEFNSSINALSSYIASL